MIAGGNTDFNQIGQGGLGGMGMGGFGLVGLFGLLNNRRGGGIFGGDDGDGAGAAGAAILAAVGNAKDIGVAEARALSAEVCDVKANVKDALYASAIQAERNTAQLSTQAQAIAALTDSKLDLMSRQIAADGDATRALINQNTIQALRDQLEHSHRFADKQSVDISIQNTANATQAQAQAQFQIQTQRDFDLHRRLDFFDNQINAQKQGIINLGTMVASGTQATQATNIK